MTYLLLISLFRRKYKANEMPSTQETIQQDIAQKTNLKNMYYTIPVSSFVPLQKISTRRNKSTKSNSTMNGRQCVTIVNRGAFIPIYGLWRANIAAAFNHVHKKKVSIGERRVQGSREIAGWNCTFKGSRCVVKLCYRPHLLYARRISHPSTLLHRSPSFSNDIVSMGTCSTWPESGRLE